MGTAVVFKPTESINDNYQGSISTQYARDQTTGQLFLKSGTNTRCIVPEMFKTAVFVGDSNWAENTTNTVYTVPDGKVLLLLGVTLQISSKAATYGNAATMDIDGVEVLRGFGNNDASGIAYAITQNLTSFIVLMEKKKIEVTTQTANMKATGGFFGYLIDRAEFYPA